MGRRRRTYSLPADTRFPRGKGVWLVLLGLAGLGTLWSLYYTVFRPGPPSRNPTASFLPATVPPTGRAPFLALPPTVPDLPVLVPAKLEHSSTGRPSQRVIQPSESRRAENSSAGSFHPRHPTNVLELQIALASLGINGGPIDGILGQQTADALRTFQRRSRLAVTGRPDPTTYRALTLTRNPFARTVVSEADVRSLVQIPDTWAGKSMLSSMGFESILEALSERSHSHPNLVRRLNPHVDWSRIVPGMEVLLPNPVEAVPRRAARIQISILSRHLQVVDEMGLIVAHFPCSVGQIASRRPVGELRVTVIVKDPNYTFDPSVFPESKEGRMLARRLLLKPGPNNPVGTTWIGLDKPGFGIHGTPHPEKVGRSESHGCFRLANWNADQLRRMAWVGLPVSISEAD